MSVKQSITRVMRYLRCGAIGPAGLLNVCLLLATGAFTSARAAEPLCPNAMTTVEINACLNEALAGVENRLNATYKKVLVLLDQRDGMGRPQEQQKELLIKAQRHWVQFREANCYVVWLLNADGTVRVSQSVTCKIELAEQREAQLRKWFLPG